MTAAPLSSRCEVCGAGVGVECANTIKPGDPLPGRRFHIGRTELHKARSGTGTPKTAENGSESRPEARNPRSDITPGGSE